MSNRVGVAVIGCGYWGVNYVRLVNELPETVVRMVCDKSEDRLNEVSKRFSDKRINFTTNLSDILNDDDIKAAIVCTHASSHFDIADQLLRAGKHVLIEKPMTTSMIEAERLAEIADQHQRKLMVGHVFLFNPGIEKIKSYITQKKIDRVYYLYARRTNLGPIRRDVNAIWDLATHDVSIFNYLLGSTPLQVSAVGAKVLGNHQEDVGFMTLTYPNGVIGHIHVSWADPNKERELVVVGSNMRISFDDLNAQERVRVFEKGVSVDPEPNSFGEHQLMMRDGDIISPHVAVNEPLKSQVKHFIDSIANNTQPVSDGWFGRDVVQVMENIQQSVHQNGRPIEMSSVRRPVWIAESETVTEAER